MPESKTQNKYARPERQASIPARRPHMYAWPEGQASIPQGLELHLVSSLFKTDCMASCKRYHTLCM